ncbi:MAG TPA: hypothetical protein VGK22_19535 [Candidatus Angelobacter sp.]
MKGELNILVILEGSGWLWHIMKEQNTPSSHKNIIGGKFSRRKFLTVAGASALALPLLKPWQAFGQATPATADPNSPNPWLMRGANVDAIPDMVKAGIPITGVRHYCAANTVPSVWPAPPGTVAAGSNSQCSWQGGTVTIPNLIDVSMCVTIYPLVNTLLAGGYDTELQSLMSTAKPREMLSLWHEASNITQGAPGKIDGDGVRITGNVARAMQVYLYNFAKTGSGTTTPTASQIQNPVYKCAIGAVDIGHWNDAVPWMAPGLDFYAMDLYEAQFPDPSAVLNGWDYQVRLQGHGAPGATVAVAECNSHIDSHRECYFYTAAKWVWNQTNRGARSFLTFWNGDGTLGGCWSTAGPGTITELTNIGSQDYTNPGGCPEPYFN